MIEVVIQCEQKKKWFEYKGQKIITKYVLIIGLLAYVFQYINGNE